MGFLVSLLNCLFSSLPLFLFASFFFPSTLSYFLSLLHRFFLLSSLFLVPLLSSYLFLSLGGGPPALALPEMCPDQGCGLEVHLRRAI